MRILITGASGVIGRILTKALTSDHSLILVDLRSLEETADHKFRQIATQYKYVRLDISNQSSIQQLIITSKPDAVIHLAAVLGRHASWEEILGSNIVGAINVIEVSLDAQVDRVIYASSNNVYGGYEQEATSAGNPLHMQENPRLLTEDTQPRPDSRYAIAKLMIEEYANFISRYYKLRTFGLRIGTVREMDNPELQSEETQLIPRFKTTWLYHQDLIQLFHLCLTTGLKHGIYNAISGKPGTPGIFIDVSKAINELSYSPKGRNHD
jgi:nucleoside-diphosphate-sugar epimerase